MQKNYNDNNEFLLADNPLVAKSRTTGFDWCCPSPRQLFSLKILSEHCLPRFETKSFLSDRQWSKPEMMMMMTTMHDDGDNDIVEQFSLLLGHVSGTRFYPSLLTRLL